MMKKSGHSFKYVIASSSLLIIASLALLRAQEPARSSSLGSRLPDVPSLRNRQFGFLVSAGLVPFYEDRWRIAFSGGQRYLYSEKLKLNLMSGSIAGGWMLSGVRGPRPLRGRPELAVELIPVWVADYPRQLLVICSRPLLYQAASQCQQLLAWGPYHPFGASITPFLLRWNFMRSNDSHAIPWAQLGGGLLWTNHKFPLLGGSTSVINFTPQIGFGESTFVRKNQSLDFAFKVVHISNAGLGDNNPGINFTLQFSVGYSWWK